MTKLEEAIYLAKYGNDVPQWVVDEVVKAAEAYAKMQWQPIETAPMDGGIFLVCLPRMMNLIIRARFDRVHKQWLSERETDGGISRVEFFHAGDFWAPLLEPPEEK